MVAEKDNPPFTVFLCHASDDKPRVRDLYRQLTEEGIDVWFDEERLLPGQDWGFEIDGALRSAHAIIVCLSNRSVTKEGFIQKEIRKAFDIADEKPDGVIFIIPVRLEACTVPRRFAPLQYVDVYEAGGYEKIIAALALRAESLGRKLTSAKKKKPIR